MQEVCSFVDSAIIITLQIITLQTLAKISKKL